MPILNLQRQMRELGRIRTGNQVATGNGGRKRPAKLDTFRLTSSSETLIKAAREAYGGVVTPWDNNGSPEWEVITTVDVLDIVVPPGQPVSQWNELWSGGGCLRRCDGFRELLSDTPCGSQPTKVSDDKVIPPCPAEPEERNAAAQKGLACKMTTRLNVILPKLPDLGVWRLESHGYYAATEIAGAADILVMASSRGQLIPARLRLEQRDKKVPGKPTLKWATPIIEFHETSMADLTMLTAGASAAQLGAGRPSRPELPATTPPPSSDFRAPLPVTQPTGLTNDALRAALEEEGISLDYAVETSKRLYPREPGVPLTDEQRAGLLAALVEEARQPAAAL